MQVDLAVAAAGLESETAAALAQAAHLQNLRGGKLIEVADQRMAGVDSFGGRAGLSFEGRHDAPQLAAQVADRCNWSQTSSIFCCVASSSSVALAVSGASGRRSRAKENAAGYWSPVRPRAPLRLPPRRGRNFPASGLQSLRTSVRTMRVSSFRIASNMASARSWKTGSELRMSSLVSTGRIDAA